MKPPPSKQDKLIGCMLGTALGDSIGLPYEGLNNSRATRLLGPPDRQRLFFGRGFVSDDTEHTCMIAQALIASHFQLQDFTRSLARRFRYWLVMLPAGVGMATAKSILRLWIGVPPERSGVFSAGNGPAMRSAIIGATVENRQLMIELVQASTRLTHTDPKAEFGAIAVALAAQLASQHTVVQARQFHEELSATLPQAGTELIELIAQVVASVESQETTQEFAKSLGMAKRVSGYVYESVPVAIHAWLSNQTDFRLAVTNVIECGGDTDSTGAIVGGIVGASLGEAGLPQDWISQLTDWPYSVTFIRKLAIQLASSIESQAPTRPMSPATWGILPRNFCFLLIVLFHGFRRLLPPY